MNWNASFTRKVVYISAIAVLLFPLFSLGRTATTKNPGGELSRIRRDNNLAQAQLGKIDPASETMKLATLGMRGVASMLLAQQAFEQKKKKQWHLLSATNETRTKLQPNFVSIWEFEGHNLSYNVSVEFDNYQQRYHWVKKGIRYMQEGTQYNRNNPRLLWQLGWFTGQKIGKSDEHIFFRDLFRADDEFHGELAKSIPRIDDAVARGYDYRPDNWLAARLWYDRGLQAIASKDVPLTNLMVVGQSDQYRMYQGKSPLVYEDNAHHQKINYAKALSEEGVLDEKHRYAWSQAHDEWTDFGNRDIATTWGTLIRLGDFSMYSQQRSDANDRLGALQPGLRDQLREEKYAKLTEEERKAYEKPFEERNQKEYADAISAENKLKFNASDFMARLPQEIKPEARKITRQIEELDERLRQINSYRAQCNYKYWLHRCRAEQMQESTDARRFVYQADEAYKSGDIVEARELYEKAWAQWRVVLDKSEAAPSGEDSYSAREIFRELTEEDLEDSISRYRVVLLQFDEKWPPKDFPLKELLTQNEQQMGGSEEAGLGTPDERDMTPNNTKDASDAGADGDANSQDSEESRQSDERPPEPGPTETSSDEASENATDDSSSQKTLAAETTTPETDSD